jgi:predicted DNA-binding transcriptional regulator YafY
MKSQRLLAITMLLLGRDSVSAPELAKRFEVSVRTIYRDIEALSEAGIPIVAYPGAGGGYGIMGDFKIDRSLLKPVELGQLSSTLGSLSKAIGDARLGQVADRLKALSPRRPAPRRAEAAGGAGAPPNGGGAAARKPRLLGGPEAAAARGESSAAGAAAGTAAAAASPENYLFIELAPAAREREKIGVLRRAIEEGRLVDFSYVDSGGKPSRRSAEPYALVFTWQAWYLYAFCRARDDFRLFKIARMKGPTLAPERFRRREVDLDSRPWNSGWEEASPFRETRIRFADAARIEEHFAERDIEPEPDGGAIIRTVLPADEWAVSFLLGLGIPFEVLEPPELRAMVAERAELLRGRNA